MDEYMQKLEGLLKTYGEAYSEFLYFGGSGQVAVEKAKLLAHIERGRQGWSALR